MTIGIINNGEVGSSVRTKLNSTINQVNTNTTILNNINTNNYYYSNLRDENGIVQFNDTPFFKKEITKQFKLNSVSVGDIMINESGVLDIKRGVFYRTNINCKITLDSGTGSNSNQFKHNFNFINKESSVIINGMSTKDYILYNEVHNTSNNTISSPWSMIVSLENKNISGVYNFLYTINIYEAKLV